jgi:hypothetical protein
MAEVTYYAALPFVAGDDGIAAGEPTGCFNPMAEAQKACNKLTKKLRRPNSNRPFLTSAQSPFSRCIQHPSSAAANVRNSCAGRCPVSSRMRLIHRVGVADRVGGRCA